MTIQTSSNKTIALGNGSQTQFAFSFVGVAAAYIGVIYTDASGNETILTQGSGALQFQIALNAPVNGALWGVGGTVTYDPSGTPIAVGTSLTIFRTLPLTQAISLQNLVSLASLGNGAETGLDTLEMQLQQVNELFSRAIVAPIVDPATINLTLPAAAQRANTGLAFDGQGNVIAGTIPATGTISSAMAPVVNAASLAAGRSALGLGNVAVENIGPGLQDNGAGSLEVNSPLTSVSTNQTVTAASAQQAYVATGPINFSLARVNTLWNGFSFELFVLGGPVTLVPNASDAVQGQSSGTTVAIPANSYALVSCDGAASGNWHVAWAPWNVDGASKAMIGPVAFGAARGLVVTNDAGTPNTKIDVTASDLVMVNGSGYGIKAAAVSLVIDLTTGTGTSTPNGLDGEAIPANGWLYLWAISNGVTTAGLASTSSTAPTLSAGYSFKKYLGAMPTASSILLRTLQHGNATQYQATAGSNTARPPVMAFGAAGTNSLISPVLAAVAVAGFVPATASAITLNVTVDFGAAGAAANVIVAPSLAYSGTNNGPQGANGVIAPYANAGGSPIVAPLNNQLSMLLESSNIYWMSAGPGGAIACQGWTDGNI
jgi:hypothetical protein